MSICVIILLMKCLVEDKCNLFLNTSRSLLSRAFLTMVIFLSMLVACVSFVVIAESENIVDGLKDVPSMLYLGEIDSFLGKYFMRYLNSSYPEIANNISFLHFKMSVRSMKGTNLWSRISVVSWSSWFFIDLYLAKTAYCPNQSFDEWYEGKHGLVNSKANNVFQSIMSYAKLIISLIGSNLTFFFPVTLRVAKHLSNPQVIEENSQEQESVNLHKEFLV